MTPAKKQLVFLVNPRSGVQRNKALAAVIDKALDQQTFSYDIRETKYPQHGTTLARTAAAAGAYGVIAVGGDGSVNDVATGLFETKTVLGILPMGSGNGMARTLGISLNLTKAIELINQNNILPIDAGFANEKLFVSNAGIGFDALISKVFAKSKKRGFANYARLSGKHYFKYKPSLYAITADGTSWEEEAFFINVANGRQFGYNFQVAPQASYSDGLLDLVIVRPFPKWKGFGIAIRGFRGALLKSPYVRHLQCRSVQISSKDEILLQADGDALPSPNSVSFRVAPAALNVFLPK